MGIFDKIKSSVSDASQKASNWVSDTSQKTKDAVTKAVDKMSAKSQGETDQNLQDIEVNNVTMHDFQQTVSEEQVSPEDVATRNGKAKNIIDDLIEKIRTMLASINKDELLAALHEYQEKSGKDISILVEFIEQLFSSIGEVATRGVWGFLVLLRNTPFATILKLAKSILKVIPIPGIPIIITILEMMIKVEWLLQKVLDIIINQIEKKQQLIKSQSIMSNLKLTNSSTVAELKENFYNKLGTRLRVYQGRSQASDDTRLGDLGLKNETTINVDADSTVGVFCSNMIEQAGLKVKVYTCDEWVAVLNELTLAEAAKVKKGAVKADMEKILTTRGAAPTTQSPHKNHIRVEVDIVEHEYAAYYGSEEEITDTICFNGDNLPNDIRVFVDGKLLDLDEEFEFETEHSDYTQYDLEEEWNEDGYFKFGHFDNVANRVWVFDVENFDIAKLTFYFECFDAIFSPADYESEEHRFSLRYDGEELDEDIDAYSCSDGYFEEQWSLSDDDECEEEESDDEESPLTEDNDIKTLLSNIFASLALVVAHADDKIEKEEIEAILGIADEFDEFDIDIVKQRLMLEKMGIRNYDSHSALAKQVPEEYYITMVQALTMVALSDYKVKEAELDVITALAEIWDMDIDEVNYVVNTIVKRFAASNSYRELEIE